MNTQTAVLNAVSETDSSELPLESDVMKLEMFPPGHDATRIIPRAIIGDIQFPIAMISSKVSAGRNTSWHTIPATIDLGFFMMSTNVEGLMPSATPNITNARTIVRRVEPPFIVTFKASRFLMTSSFILVRFSGLSRQSYYFYSIGQESYLIAYQICGEILLSVVNSVFFFNFVVKDFCLCSMFYW